jgi:hypothetical protein
MEDYRVADLAYMLGGVTIVSRDLSTSDQLEQPISDDKFCRNLGTLLDGLQITCNNFEADPAILGQLERFSTELIKLESDRRAAVLKVRLDTILEAIRENLESRKFLFIPVQDVVYWDNAELFGPAVRVVFDGQAADEIREAGSCYATNRYTASVFHCMRVAEFALRMLAKNLSIKLIHNGKRQPLEYAEWDKVIQQIKNKLIASRQKTRGKKREDLLNFYSGAADHCEYMKDIWRNEVSHCRRMYSRAEALAVLDRVNAFIGLVAQRNLKQTLTRFARENRPLPISQRLEFNN